MNKLSNSQGYFIVLEGIDGSGTSTQAELLQQYLLNENQKAVISPEPSDGKIGRLLREFLGTPPSFISDDLFEQQMAYLFASDRHYHLYNNTNGVKKLTGENTHVITTRYYFSSLAYNARNEAEFNFVWQLNSHFPPPDLLIYLDIPVDIALQRMCDRTHKEIYETKEKLTQVRENFKKIIEEYTYDYVVVDARETKEKVHKKIIDKILTLN